MSGRVTLTLRSSSLLRASVKEMDMATRILGCGGQYGCGRGDGGEEQLDGDETTDFYRAWLGGEPGIWCNVEACAKRAGTGENVPAVMELGRAAWERIVGAIWGTLCWFATEPVRPTTH